MIFRRIQCHTLFVQLLFLVNKQVLVASRGNGLVSFYDIRDIRLMYSFSANRRSESITAICTNQTNSLLVVGDIEGCIAVYNIEGIPDKAIQIHERMIKLIKRYNVHTMPVSG